MSGAYVLVMHTITASTITQCLLLVYSSWTRLHNVCYLCTRCEHDCTMFVTCVLAKWTLCAMFDTCVLELITLCIRFGTFVLLGSTVRNCSLLAHLWILPCADCGLLVNMYIYPCAICALLAHTCVHSIGDKTSNHSIGDTTRGTLTWLFDLWKII